MDEKTKQERLDVDRKFVGLFVFALICAILLIVNVALSLSFTSGLRGYIGGEGNWTKAQKESVIHLSRYIFTEKESDYKSFQSVFGVILGDRKARLELLKEQYDHDVVFEGFKEGLNHPKDIPDMIRVMRLFKNFSYIEEARAHWEAGDQKIDELITFGEHIHQQLKSGNISRAQRIEWLNELNRIDHQLTTLELNFSNAIDNMARLFNTVLKWSTIILGLIIISIGFWLILRFYNSTTLWVNTLRETEQKFRNVLQNSRDVLFKMNVNTKKYEYVSPAVQPMLGYTPEEFAHGGVSFIMARMHPDDKKAIQQVVDNYDSVSDQEFLPTLEYRIQDVSGNWKWVSNTRTMVRDADGNPSSIVGNVRDISVRKEQEQKIKESLEEKEILLKEIHHRVKNNLSIISSLLEFQKEGVSEEVKQILSSSQLRIKSIAKVHEKLYKSANLSDTSLDVYITELVEEIEKTFLSEKRTINIQTDVCSLPVDINNAITIGLIINELINNAFKHSFGGLNKGNLHISLQELDEHQLELIVKSDGNKIDQNVDLKSHDSLGMTLIKVLLQRINGSLEVEQDGEWSQFKIRFFLEDEEA